MGLSFPRIAGKCHYIGASSGELAEKDANALEGKTG
jgi:hypothetical protein